MRTVEYFESNRPSARGALAKPNLLAEVDASVLRPVHKWVGGHGAKLCRWWLAPVGADLAEFGRDELLPRMNPWVGAEKQFWFSLNRPA